MADVEDGLSSSSEALGVDSLGPLDVASRSTGPRSTRSTRSHASTGPTSDGSLQLEVPRGRGARTKSTMAQEVHAETGIWVHIAAVCLLAYAGVLTRVGLEKLTDALTSPDACADVTSFSERNLSLFNSLKCADQLGAGYWLPNIVGCIVMGLFLRLSEPITRRFPVLYTGVTTGFCGCCTTFATWNHDIALTMVKQADIVGSLVNMCIHVVVCLAMLKFGMHLGSLMPRSRLQKAAVARERAKFEALVDNALTFLDKINIDSSAPGASASGGVRRRRHLSHSSLRASGPGLGPRTASFAEPAAEADQQLQRLRMTIAQATTSFSRSFFDARDADTAITLRPDEYRASLQFQHRALAVVLAVATVGVWLGATLPTSIDTRSVWLKAALGPFGALIRYLTSLYNKRPTRCCGRDSFNVASWGFPLYTFLANVAATQIDAVLTVVDMRSGLGATFVGLWSPAIATGFCGSLSTVSTFMTETQQFKERRYSYRYMLVSLSVAQILAVLIMGSVYWY